MGNRLRTGKPDRLHPVSLLSLARCSTWVEITSFPLDFYFLCFNLMIQITFLPKYIRQNIISTIFC